MKVTDLTNQRFGNLTAVRRVEPRRDKRGYVSGTRWMLQCDCGGVVTGLYTNIAKGNLVTCGPKCPFRLARIRHGYAPGQSGLVQAWNLYRRKAKDRGIEFKLTREEAFALFKMDCYYCGVVPSNIAKSNTTYGGCLYSGIDRLDPTLGYVTGNVVPCCWNCNRMKGTLQHGEFFAHIQKILRRSRRRKENGK